jgi:hypothetical protein
MSADGWGSGEYADEPKVSTPAAVLPQNEAPWGSEEVADFEPPTPHDATAPSSELPDTNGAAASAVDHQEDPFAAEEAGGFDSPPAKPAPLTQSAITQVALARARMKQNPPAK